MALVGFKFCSTLAAATLLPAAANWRAPYVGIARLAALAIAWAAIRAWAFEKRDAPAIEPVGASLAARTVSTNRRLSQFSTTNS
jgi:hypothetical protein